MTANKPTAEQLERWRAEVDQVHAERVCTTPPGPSGLPRERRGKSRNVSLPPSLDDLGRRVYGYGGAVGSMHVSAPANGGVVAAIGHGGETDGDHVSDLSEIGRRMFGF